MHLCLFFFTVHLPVCSQKPTRATTRPFADWVRGLYRGRTGRSFALVHLSPIFRCCCRCMEGWTNLNSVVLTGDRASRDCVFEHELFFYVKGRPLSDVYKVWGRCLMKGIEVICRNGKRWRLEDIRQWRIADVGWRVTGDGWGVTDVRWR